MQGLRLANRIKTKINLFADRLRNSTGQEQTQHPQQNLQQQIQDLQQNLQKQLQQLQCENTALKNNLAINNQTINAISQLFKAIGIQEHPGVIDSLTIANAIKTNILGHSIDSCQGGNTDITPGSEPRIIFFHIPKTGGISLYRELLQHYHPLSICPARMIEYQNEPGSNHQARQYGLSDRFITGQTNECFSGEEYLAHFPPYLYRIVGGHFPINVFRRYQNDFDTITILRHPAKRIYSCFTYLRQEYRPIPNSTDYFEKTSLRDFLDAFECRTNDCINPTAELSVHNYYARTLTGIAPPKNFDPDIKEHNDYLQLAIKQLDSITHIGFIEDLDATDRFMQAQYNFTTFNVNNRKDNAIIIESKEKPEWKRSHFASKEDCLDAIGASDLCSIDNILYAYAANKHSKNRKIRNIASGLATPADISVTA